MLIDATMQGWRTVTIQLVGFSVRGPRSDGDEYLVTLRGVDEAGAPVVAFQNGTNLLDVMTTIGSRLANGSFKWRPDEFGR